jgi:uncharacterized protein (DUF2461 family)
LEPALDFIADFAPRLERISPHFRADPRPTGGSLLRIYMRFLCEALTLPY